MWPIRRAAREGATRSSGGKSSLGRITKRGDDYLRTLLIQGAKSAVMSAHKRDDPISHWLVQLKERIGWQKAAWRWPNKNARILWSVLTREKAYDPHHVSVKQQSKVPIDKRVPTAPSSTRARPEWPTRADQPINPSPDPPTTSPRWTCSRRCMTGQTGSR